MFRFRVIATDQAISTKPDNRRTRHTCDDCIISIEGRAANSRRSHQGIVYHILCNIMLYRKKSRQHNSFFYDIESTRQVIALRYDASVCRCIAMKLLSSRCHAYTLTPWLRFLGLRTEQCRPIERIRDAQPKK